MLLVRHAQGSLGTADYDRLSDTGHRQAAILGDALRRGFPDAEVVRGGLRRHRQTAERIDGGDIADVDPDLDEYRVDGLLAAALGDADRLGIRRPSEAALQDPVAYLDTFLELFPEVLSAWQAERLSCDVNGPWREFRRRVVEAGSRIERRLDTASTVVAVTSAGVISTLAAVLLDHGLDWQRRLNVALYNASVTELRHGEDGRWTLQRAN
ncbi:MAG: histidine phosphatase family protein, partial [Wenzhouxiangellaceae bacterium]|nr:histidine phosphatase family protein [Wenzhouxiangellaceae bacterium]